MAKKAPSGADFGASRDGLIGMYRSLWDYCCVLQASFDDAASFDDPAAHYDEIMASFNITYDAAAGENKYLAEYDRWAAQVVL